MKHSLASMTYPEFKARMRDDPVILLPLGSVGVRGPCNPNHKSRITTNPCFVR